LDAAMTASVTLSRNWWSVKDWSETKRYHVITEAEARTLYAAIEDPANGVLPWLKTYW
jgi:hypothetical protein